MVQRDDGGFDLVVCGRSVEASIDIGGQNKPPRYVGAFDIDGDGSQELFYAGTTGGGEILFATTLAEGSLASIEYSWPVILEVGDAETPLAGTSFTCNGGRVATLTFAPDGENVRVLPAIVELAEGDVTTEPSEPFELSPDAAFALWADFASCFSPASQP